MNNRRCIVIPYFGKLPVYFDFFLKSCSNNQEVIDYLFFTDCEKPDKLPSNVKWNSFSLVQFNQLASKKLEKEIRIENPYKLCDFKPLYGHIFEDSLSSYEYWGFGDEDLILGRLDFFLSDLEKGSFDVFSMRERWISGPFSLFRNVEKVNKLYQKSPIWESIMLQKEWVAFDETLTNWNDYMNYDLDVYSFDDPSFTSMVFDAKRDGVIEAHFNTLIKESIDDDSYVCYDNGVITDASGREFAIYHYIIEKKRFQFEFEDWNHIPDKFYIDNTGFFTEDEFWNSRDLIRRKRIRRGKLRQLKHYARRFKEKYILNKG